MESLFDQVLEVLEQTGQVVKARENVALVDCGPIGVLVGRGCEHEVCLRWFMPVEEEFTTEHRQRKVAELLVEQTGHLRATPAAEHRSAWFVDPRDGRITLEHIFEGEAAKIAVALKWMVVYVVEFLPVLVSQLYGRKNWHELYERKAAEREKERQAEASLAEAVNGICPNEEYDDEQAGD